MKDLVSLAFITTTHLTATANPVSWYYEKTFTHSHPVQWRNRGAAVAGKGAQNNLAKNIL